MKGAITRQNYEQLFYSLDGDLVDEVDDFYCEPNSPILSAVATIDPDQHMDVDMGCGIKTIEQVNFSGLESQSIIADTVGGCPPTCSQTANNAVQNDSEMDVDWDSMITSSSQPTTASVSCNSSTNMSTYGASTDTSLSMAVSPRSQVTQGVDSFPPPEQFDLAQAQATPMNAPECAFCTGRGEYHEVSCQSAQGPECAFCTVRLNCHEAFCRSNPPFSPVYAQGVTPQIDDDLSLAAAAEVMTLDPPFWPSSLSDSSDDEDDSTFANNGWGFQAPGRDWTRRGAVNGEGVHSGT